MEFKMQENGFVTTFEYGDLHISADENYGFRPYQLMISSIAVCSGGVLKRILLKQRMDIEDITIQADFEKADTPAGEIKTIKIHFLIKGSNLKESKIEKAMELTRKNCTMVQSVQDSIDIIETFELIQ